MDLLDKFLLWMICSASKKNVLQLWEHIFTSGCFLEIDSYTFREGTKMKLSHQH